MSDLQICSAVFDLMDDEITRFECPILYSAHSIERHEDDLIFLKWTAWCVDKRGGVNFKEISAANSIMVENWSLKLSGREFKEVVRAVSDQDSEGLIAIVSSFGEPEIDISGFDLIGLSKAIFGYNNFYTSSEIGREIVEWFGDEKLNLNSFPSLIHPMLVDSLRRFRSEELERDSHKKRMRLQFDLASPDLDVRLNPDTNPLEAGASFRQGLAVFLRSEVRRRVERVP